MSDTSPGALFLAATQSQPLPVVEETTSSCCGPKPAAKTADAKTTVSSCCGPAAKSSTATGEPATTAAAQKKSSCCG